MKPTCKTCHHFVPWANDECGDCTLKLPPWVMKRVGENGFQTTKPDDTCSFFMPKGSARIADAGCNQSLGQTGAQTPIKPSAQPEGGKTGSDAASDTFVQAEITGMPTFKGKDPEHLGFLLDEVARLTGTCAGDAEGLLQAIRNQKDVASAIEDDAEELDAALEKIVVGIGLDMESVCDETEGDAGETADLIVACFEEARIAVANSARRADDAEVMHKNTEGALDKILIGLNLHDESMQVFGNTENADSAAEEVLSRFRMMVTRLAETERLAADGRIALDRLSSIASLTMLALDRCDTSQEPPLQAILELAKRPVGA